MGDQRLVVGLLSSGSRSLRACDDQGRFQRFDVACSGSTTRIHTQMKSQILAEDSSKIEASATILHVPDETYEADSANRFHRAYTPTARPRFQLRRRPATATGSGLSPASYTQLRMQTLRIQRGSLCGSRIHSIHCLGGNFPASANDITGMANASYCRATALPYGRFLRNGPIL